jgi:hypothetical protein
VIKRYRALIAYESSADSDGPFAPGETLIHYLDRGTGTPRRYFHSVEEAAQSGSGCGCGEPLYCESRVVAVSQTVTKTAAEWLQWIAEAALDQPVSLPLQAAFSQWFGERKGSLPPRTPMETGICLQEVEVDLATGRTHQVRAQLQSLGRSSRWSGLHIAGDHLYCGCTSIDPTTAHKSSPFLALQVLVSCIPSSRSVASVMLLRFFVAQSRHVEFLYDLESGGSGDEAESWARYKRRISRQRSVGKGQSRPEMMASEGGKRVSYSLEEVWWSPLHRLLYRNGLASLVALRR